MSGARDQTADDAPQRYAEPRIGRRGVSAVAFAAMSFVAGLGWGVCVTGTCGVLSFSASLSAAPRVTAIVAACLVFGCGLGIMTRHYVPHERVALLLGYVIATALTAPFVVNMFGS